MLIQNQLRGTTRFGYSGSKENFLFASSMPRVCPNTGHCGVFRCKAEGHPGKYQVRDIDASALKSRTKSHCVAQRSLVFRRFNSAWRENHQAFGARECEADQVEASRWPAAFTNSRSSEAAPGPEIASHMKAAK